MQSRKEEWVEQEWKVSGVFWYIFWGMDDVGWSMMRYAAECVIATAAALVW